MVMVTVLHQIYNEKAQINRKNCQVVEEGIGNRVKVAGGMGAIKEGNRRGA